MTGHKGYVRVPREQGEMFEQLKHQIDFMIVGAQLYDQGNTERIKMSTPAMRTLFYDLRQSSALIKRISVINLHGFLSTNWNSGTESFYTGPVFSSPCIDGKIRYFPACYLSNHAATKKMIFSDWWEETIMASQGVTLTRHELVQFVANTDGGAHVDEKLASKYSLLVHNALSAEWSTKQHQHQYAEGYGLALLRQIVHESVVSFKHMHFMDIKYKDGSGSPLDKTRIQSFPMIQSSFQWLDDEGKPIS